MQGGVVGLWRGCWPNVQRAALVNLGDLSTYDSVKTAILDNTGLQDNYVTHCMASGCAGLVFILFHLFIIEDTISHIFLINKDTISSHFHFKNTIMHNSHW